MGGWGVGDGGWARIQSEARGLGRRNFLWWWCGGGPGPGKLARPSYRRAVETTLIRLKERGCVTGQLPHKRRGTGHITWRG